MRRQWLYHAIHDEEIFHDEDIAAHLADGWSEKHVPKVAVPEDPWTRERLEAQAQLAGIRIDRRWGLDRLRQEVIGE